MLFDFLKQYCLRMSFQPCHWIRCNEIGQRNRGKLSIQISRCSRSFIEPNWSHRTCSRSWAWNNSVSDEAVYLADYISEMRYCYRIFLELINKFIYLYCIVNSDQHYFMLTKLKLLAWHYSKFVFHVFKFLLNLLLKLCVYM